MASERKKKDEVHSSSRLLLKQHMSLKEHAKVLGTSFFVKRTSEQDDRESMVSYRKEICSLFRNTNIVISMSNKRAFKKC